MLSATMPVSVVARVNSDCADWGMSNADEFTHGTHDRNLNPATPAANGPFPPGTYRITGVESGRGMGPKFIVFRGQGAAGERKTWVHSGAGEDWTKKTKGCIRGRESDITWLSELYELNRNNGNRHRVTVSRRGTAFGRGIGNAIGEAIRGPSVMLPVLFPRGGLL